MELEKELVRSDVRYILKLYTDNSFRLEVGILYDNDSYDNVYKRMEKELERNPSYSNRIRIEEEHTNIYSIL